MTHTVSISTTGFWQHGVPMAKRSAIVCVTRSLHDTVIDSICFSYTNMHEAQSGAAPALYSR